MYIAPWGFIKLSHIWFKSGAHLCYSFSPYLYDLRQYLENYTQLVMRSSLQDSCKRHGTQLLECSKYSIPQQILGSLWLPNDLWVILCSAEDRLNIIWQPEAARDLLWNWIFTTFQQLRPMSFTTILKGRTSVDNLL